MRRPFFAFVIIGVLSIPSALRAEPPMTAPVPGDYAWKTGITPTTYTIPSLNKDLYYVALPFDDLKHADLAQKWLPPAWLASLGGKPISACQGRWIQVKNSEGRSCYAQWMGTGPLATDDADYVFGTAAPKEKESIGIALSPWMTRQLGEYDSGPVSWRFVDDRQVPPGMWLIYQEEDLILTAITTRDKAASGKAAPPNAGTPLLFDKYLTAYLLMNRAENDEKDKNLAAARDTFRQVQDQFKQIESLDPNWERVLIIRRLEDIHAKLDEIGHKLSAPPEVH